MHSIWAWTVVLALAACKKAEPPAGRETRPAAVPGDAGGAADPAIADAAVADAAVADVDLLYHVPMHIRVSSRVANKKIRPAHLVDGDLTTAWNSETGDLVGAWIEITVPDGAEIHELRLTAGFTAKGPRGEDWFTMNPRIRRLDVSVDGNPTGTITLDVDERALQPFPLRATGTVQLEVSEIVPGTKKAWREVSMSELEVWGTPPPGWEVPTPAPAPIIGVGLTDTPIDLLGPCAAIEAEREQFIAEHADDVHEGPGADDHNYPPRCDDYKVTAPDELVPPWHQHQAWCHVHDEIYGPKRCMLRFTRGAATATIAVEHDAQAADFSATLEARDPAAALDRPELLVRITHPDGESVAICRSAPALGCTPPFLVGGAGWTTRLRFDKVGMLVVEKLRGTPPPGVLGAHALVFTP